MKGRMIVAFAAGMLCCAMIVGVTLGVLGFFSDDAAARSGATWEVAGGAEGFNLADWGAGKGESVSLDEWIESTPDRCDIQTIPRGVSYVSVFYRCS